MSRSREALHLRLSDSKSYFSNSEGNVTDSLQSAYTYGLMKIAKDVPSRQAVGTVKIAKKRNRFPDSGEMNDISDLTRSPLVVGLDVFLVG